MSDGQAGGAPGEATVGEECALGSEPSALEVGRGVKHLLHAGTAPGAFVADDDDVAGADTATEDGFDGGLLGFEDHSGAGEDQQRVVDAGALDQGSVDGEVAPEDGKAPVGGVCVSHIVDAPVGSVEVEVVPAFGLGERRCGTDAARGSVGHLHRVG